MNLYEMTAAELSALLTKKEITAVELLDSVEKRIDAVDGKVHAYVTRCSEQAHQQAEAVDRARQAGEQLHPLAGIPIAVKDNISTKGIRTTCSSRMLENYIPPYNATIMDQIYKSGMVVLGKTNLDEFAMGSSTETSYFGTTHNPYDLDRVPGGSSGGSAAALAAGEAIMAIGSDTGGSIRQPAALCGVVGFKPTYGAVSRYGLIAFASSLDQIGPLTKNVTDAAWLQTVLQGHDKMDATSVNRGYTNLAENLSVKKNLVIGVPKEYFGDGIDEDVKQAVYKVIDLYKANGAEIKEISLSGVKYAINTYHIIASAEASSNLARYDGVRYGYRAKEYDGLTDMFCRSRSEGFGREVQRRIMLGTFVLSSGYYDAYYKKAKMVQKWIQKEFNQAFAQCDVILTPTSPEAAFKIGEHFNNPLKMYYSDVCTATVNIAGLPAISVPCGKNAEGLPLGFQLIGKAFDEQTVLDAAYTYEQIAGSTCEMANL